MAIVEVQRGGVKRYVVRFDYRRDPDTGKRKHSERWFRHRREAERFQAREALGATGKMQRITIAEIAAEYQARHLPTLAKRTQSDYRTQLDRRVLPLIGDARAARLTTGDLTQWMRTPTMAANPRSANKARDMLASMLAWARSEGLTQCAATDDLNRLPTPPPEEANPRTPKQVAALAKRMPTMQDRTLVLVAAYTGLRWSELRALEWGDIDLDERRIRVTRSIDLDRSDKATKSERPRTVPILRPGREALAQWKAVATGERVFATRTGAPLNSDWYASAKAAAGQRVSLHEMRDTYASLLIAAGIGEAELTLWLGHKSVELTVRRYARLFEERKTHLASVADERIDEMLSTVA